MKKYISFSNINLYFIEIICLHNMMTDEKYNKNV